MKRKKIIIIICIIAAAAAIAAAAYIITHRSSNQDQDISVTIEQKTAAYATDLQDSANTLTTNAKIKDYLCNWAKTKGISYTTDDSGNVIMKIKSSTKYQYDAPTVILCPYDAGQFANCIAPMATALYIAKNNENTGTLKVIFVSENDHDYAGIKDLSSKYFTNDSNVFCLSYGAKPMFSLNCGARSSYTFKSSASFTKPTLTKAYEITISGLPGGIPDSKISSYPNPVKELSDVLATLKTNSYIYELAGFSGGTSGNVYPKSATMTLVIDQEDAEKFTGKLDTYIENYMKDNQSDYPDLKYTYKEVDLPDKVLTSSSTNKFVSFMYTLLDGVYYKDDQGNLVSITSIGSVHHSDSSYTISVVANSLQADNLTEIDNSYATISSLSNVKYKKTSSQSGWASDETTDFANEVKDAFTTYSGADMQYRDSVPSTFASYVYGKNKKCHIVSITENEEKIERYTGTIITFLINEENQNN